MSVKIILNNEEHAYLKKELLLTARHGKWEPEFIDLHASSKRVEKCSKTCDCAYCRHMRKEDELYNKKYKPLYESIKEKLGKTNAKGSARLSFTADERELLKWYVKRRYLPIDVSLTKRTIVRIEQCNCLACKRFRKVKAKNEKDHKTAKKLLEKLK